MVNWSSDNPYLVLHRLAVNPVFRKQGIGGIMMSYAEEYAKTMSFYYLRTDTNSQNTAMNALFHKHNYTKCGEVHFRSLPIHFNCYDKILS